MKFYLDKNLAKQGIAKCIAVSKIELNSKELEERKKYFDVQEAMIFEGNDIPHKFKYNEKLNIIEEIKEIEKVSPRILSQEELKKESDFDESVEVDTEKQYFYIDKEYADKFFKSQIIAVFPQPLRNPAVYFDKEVYCYLGKDIPYYITVEKDVVREATEYEKYQRNQRKLEEGEVVLEIKKEIVLLSDGQYVNESEEVITVPCPAEYLVKEWDKVKHTWIDLTTDLDIAKLQYSEYEPLDTPLNLARLEKQGLKEEYVNMMNQLFEIIPQLSISSQGYTRIVIPKPSQQLINFKENFEKIGG